MLPIAVRSAIESLMIAARLRERPALVGPSPMFVNLIDAFPLELALSSRLRDPATVRRVTTHVTDIRGGFGVDKRRVAHWREVGPPPLLAAQGVEDPALVALLERYHRCAYHGLASRAFGGLIIRNHPAKLRTSHGNGGNVGLGWALDAHHAEVLEPRFVAIACESLRETIIHAYLAGGEQVAVDAHRCHSAKRLVDIDGLHWRSIVLPTVRELGSTAAIDYEVRTGTGRPIPRTWDPAAHFDAKGRRVV